MRTHSRTLAALFFAVASSGCSVVGRVSAMPIVDTEGIVGAQLRVGGALGVTTTFDHERNNENEKSAIGLLALPASVAGELRASSDGGARLGLEGGVEYVSVGRHPRDIGLRVGLLFSGRFDAGGPASPGATLAAGVPFVLSERRARLTLGPAAEATYLRIHGERDVGQLGVGVSLDWYGLTEWTIR